MITFNFNKKVAIVTGSGTGIGFEIAKQLAIAGASVVLNDIDEQMVSTSAEQIRELGGKCEVVVGDSSEIDSIVKMVATAVSSFGQLDMVVANAGITTFGGFLDYTLSDFKKLVEVNLQGSFFLSQEAAKQMISQNSGGRILLMSSVTGHQAHPNLTAYGMSKAALEMLAKSLAVELGNNGITVNAVAPGATLTERTEQDPDYKKAWEKITPLGKAATVQDVANTALFLLSNQSGHITGQSIIVDGGWTAYSPPPK